MAAMPHTLLDQAERSHGGFSVSELSDDSLQSLDYRLVCAPTAGYSMISSLENQTPTS
jgi:hypothetical protein